MTIWRGPVGTGQKAGAAATRLRIAPWRDPRFVLGVLLVLGATVLGARLAAGGDDAVSYWAVSRDVVAGDPVREDDLVATRVSMDDDTSATYLRTDAELEAPFGELVWAHGAGRGSLVSRTAVDTAAASGLAQLPLDVATGALPHDLARGDLVDVWVGPGPGETGADPAARVLEGVRVARVGDDSVGTLSRTVLVETAAASLQGDVVGTVGAGHVTLVRVP